MLEVYPTGFSELDQRFGGIRPGELTVLIGFPSTGKTQVLSDIADFLDVPTLYFGQHTRPPGQWTRRRRPELFVDSTEHDDFAAIERRVRKAKRLLGVRAVIIDDVQRFPKARFATLRSPLRLRFERMPLAYDVAILVAWTVTDQDRESRHVRWSDLRGSIVEDPGLLMMLHPESDVPPITHLHAHRQDGSGVTSEPLYMRS